MSSSIVLNTLRSKHPKLALLQTCSSFTDLKIIHGFLIRTHLISDVFVASRLLSLSFKSTEYAYRIFSQIQSPNLFVFNLLIRTFSTSPEPSKAYNFYTQMLRLCIPPDNITFPFLIKASAEMECVGTGAQIHSHIVRFGFHNDVYVENSLVHMYATCGSIASAGRVFGGMSFRNVVSWTSMVDGYCKCGLVDDAREMFDEMPHRNLVTWSIMINGYAKSNRFEEAVELFEVMQREGVVANETVMVSVVSSCAHLGALGVGVRAHEYVVENRMNVDLVLGTALVEMYWRCGEMEKAVRVFQELDEKDSLSWSSIIKGLAVHGNAHKAVGYFSEMVRLGFVPRDVTFTAVLSACSHGGLVEKGLEIYEMMKRVYGIEPRLEHYGCIVDMLGRAGKLAEAERFIEKMPVKPNAPILGALLGACKIYKNAEVAERVGNMLLEAKPEHSGYYVLLSNIYACAGKWEKIESVREMMKEKLVKKPPAWSVIEIDGKINKFSMGDDHPEMGKIRRKWEEILGKIRFVGYKGNTEDAFFDVDEEEKESAIHMHSEKLAIAYGMIKTKRLCPDTLLVRLGWNKQDPRYMATIIMDSAKVVVLDIRFPALPVVELQRHQASVNAIAWAPHSSLHICTAGDDSQALIWDISLMGQKNLPSPAQPPSESVEHAARAFCEHRYDKPEKKSVPLSHDRSHTEPWYLHGFSENEGSAYTMKQLILL